MSTYTMPLLVEWENTPQCWRNFVIAARTEHGADLNWEHLIPRLAEYNAVRQAGNASLIFDSEEDAITFKLRWS